VKTAIATLVIGYPVAIDNELQDLACVENEYWPAHYFMIKGRFATTILAKANTRNRTRDQKLLAEAATAACRQARRVNGSGAKLQPERTSSRRRPTLDITGSIVLPRRAAWLRTPPCLCGRLATTE